jgi:hypothetical protein
MTRPAMRDCPRYNVCSAPICPLDRDWRKRVHAPGERVCFYMTEAVKDAAQARFSTGGQGDMYREVSEALPEICARHPEIARAVERAKLTGSRIDAQQASGARLRKVADAQGGRDATD